jgi:hypothetical protein
MPYFVGHVMDLVRLENLDIKHLRRPCAIYFIILELLRKASEWIREAVEDLKSLEEDFNISTSQLPQRLPRHELENFWFHLGTESEGNQ